VLDQQGGGGKFSMQGYCHVAPPANVNSGVTEPSYAQFEYYSLEPNAQQPSTFAVSLTPPAERITTPPVERAPSDVSPPIGSPDGGVVHVTASTATLGVSQLTLPHTGDHSALNSAFPSPVHSPVRNRPASSASPPGSPEAHNGSIHLFDSASFASLHMHHFEGDEYKDGSPMLSPPTTPPLSASAALSSVQQCALRLGPSAQIWSGQYVVVQTGSESRSRSGANGVSTRPRIEVAYSLQLVVTPVRSPTATSPVAAPASTEPLQP
jgi:hypothetical protein